MALTLLKTSNLVLGNVLYCLMNHKFVISSKIYCLTLAVEDYYFLFERGGCNQSSLAEP